MSEVMINDNFLRLLVWCINRGRFNYSVGAINPSTIFELSKVKRIKRLMEVLNNLNIQYSHTIQSIPRQESQSISNFIYLSTIDTGDICSYLNSKQEYPQWFLSLSKEQVKIVFNEISIACGCWMNKNTLKTYLKINKDLEILKKLNEKYFKCNYWQGKHYTGSYILKIHQLKQEIS